ncbi:membrane protein insertion efficiency factor YidD [Candidatus Uhrbacteria bacterium]|nr:membrane protein insertion efficiency factor YidD [Candidatus Uhrbacteria bacterium]MBD3284596.1 membrane protein insertion efficiency factor YidD [Candidatus Uhrbacteria bacterium]
MSLLRFLWYIPRRIAQGFIVIYQHTLSPDHGMMSVFFKYRVCIFHPTCSEYGYEAIGKYGLLKGGMKTAWRILRCNPWNHGGHDPVK